MTVSHYNNLPHTFEYIQLISFLRGSSAQSEQDKRVVAAVITGMNNSTRHNNSNASMNGRIIMTTRTSVSADSAITYDHLGKPSWLGCLSLVLLASLALRYAKRILGTVYICKITTTHRRFIRQVKKIKNAEDRFIDPLPCEIDNHADTCEIDNHADTTCFGKNFRVISFTSFPHSYPSMIQLPMSLYALQRQLWTLSRGKQ